MAERVRTLRLPADLGAAECGLANGYCESFNGKLRDECLKGEIIYSLKEEQTLIERWQVEYNTQRPHSPLGYRPPAPATVLPASIDELRAQKGCGQAPPPALH